MCGSQALGKSLSYSHSGRGNTTSLEEIRRTTDHTETQSTGFSIIVSFVYHLRPFAALWCLIYGTFLQDNIHHSLSSILLFRNCGPRQLSRRRRQTYTNTCKPILYVWIYGCHDSRSILISLLLRSTVYICLSTVANLR